jgi:hypothetical protein
VTQSRLSGGVFLKRAPKAIRSLQIAMSDSDAPYTTVDTGAATAAQAVIGVRADFIRTKVSSMTAAPE